MSLAPNGSATVLKSLCKSRMRRVVMTTPEQHAAVPRRATHLASNDYGDGFLPVWGSLALGLLSSAGEVIRDMLPYRAQTPATPDLGLVT